MQRYPDPLPKLLHDVAIVVKRLAELNRLDVPYTRSLEMRFAEVRLTKGDVDERAVRLQYSVQWLCQIINRRFTIGRETDRTTSSTSAAQFSMTSGGGS